MNIQAGDCCRTCLNKESLHPIFYRSEHHEKYTNLLLTATGQKITITDSFTHQMCSYCIQFINNIFKFRRKCEETQNILNKIYNNENIDDMFTEKNAIYIVDIDDFNRINISCMFDDINNEIEKYEIDSDFDYEDNISLESLRNINNLDNFQSTPYNPESNGTEEKNVNILKTKMTKDKLENTQNRKKRKKRDLRNLNLDIKVNGDEERQIKHCQDTEINDKELIKLKDKLNYEETDTINGQDLQLTCKRKLKNKSKRDKESIAENSKRKREAKEKSKSNKESVECETCHKVLTSRLSLANHYKLHTGFDIVCEHCGKKFISRRFLLMHCRAKHGYEKIDKCSYCDYRGSNAEQVKIHSRVHSGERPFRCRHCAATFHRRSSYLQHTHTHLTEKTVLCEQCPLRFKSVTLMKIHASKHRPPKYTYKCNVCGNTFARPRNVFRHLRQVHLTAGTREDYTRIPL